MQDKNEAFDSPAVAFANKVLPVPEGPNNRTPLLNLAPMSRYLNKNEADIYDNPVEKYLEGFFR